MIARVALGLGLAIAVGGCGGGGGAAGGGGGSGGGDVHAQHCLDQLNLYRAQNGAPPLALSSALDQFATEGSQALAAGGAPHQHFSDAASAGTLFSSGFCGGAGENQAPGWPVSNGDLDGTVDAILAAMIAGGPGEGHHDAIVSPDYRLVGVGLVVDASARLSFTNDFSGACP